MVDYFPYGKVLRHYNATEERYLTTQHERDQKTGLDYRGARYYDSDLGRFLSLDPLAKKFPSWSAYNYVLSNPIIYIDPSGKEAEITDGTADPRENEHQTAWTGNHLYLNEIFGDPSGFNEMIAPAVLNKPQFKEMWQNYPGSVPAYEIYKSIGGKVLWNYENNPAYRNSCALRMSIALNKSGAKIPYHKGQTGSGDDKNWYFYRVPDLYKYIEKAYGNADIVLKPEDSDFENKLQNAKGIIVFKINGWDDAWGHITLWDGSDCGDKCYFQDYLNSHYNGVNLEWVKVWKLK